jgi:hypothetical protein
MLFLRAKVIPVNPQIHGNVMRPLCVLNIIFEPLFVHDKNPESDYFFFPPPKSEYFFQQHWESEYFFIKKKHNPPFLQVMLNSGKKMCVLRDKKKYSNSCVVRIKNF